MAKARGVEAKLSRLRALRHEPAGPEVVAALRQALADPSNLVAAEAAEIAGTRLLSDLAPDLVAAFARFMVEPAESDKLCRAKIAIVEALNRLDQDAEEVFLQGLHHVQKEGVWGGEEDSAAQLRGNCAFALVRCNHRDVLILLADLLADREKVARQAAAQALGATGAPAANLLLRFKARTGDREPEVTADCLTALVNLAPLESLPFVTEFLHAGEEAVQEGAALALAESRRPEALDILREFWPRARAASVQEAVLLAISLLRLPAALDFLLTILAGDPRPAAQMALSALAIHRHNAALKDRIAATLAERQDPDLLKRFKEKFASTE